MKTTDDYELVLRRRYWLLANIEWLMDEVSFHRTNDEYLRNEKFVIWREGQAEGRVQVS